MKKRSVWLLISVLLASLYSIYLISYFTGTVSSTSGMEQVGGAIATAIVMPHMIVFIVGAIFGWIGYFLKASWSALVAAILYSVATLFFLLYAMFGIPILIFGFIGYVNQKKINKARVIIKEEL